METTESENWASNLISHLNSRFPTAIDTRKELQTFIKPEVEDANLCQIVSSHSYLPDLLVSNSFCQPESYMNFGYNLYNNHAS
nr:histone acetyltransferase HAC1-like isoform X2 [Tanacetum cinerariifolium]